MERLAALIAMVTIISPFVAFLLAVRQPRATVVSIITASALAAFAGGTAFYLLAAVLDAPALHLLPWVLLAVLWGAFVGTVGVGARLLGRWWSQRP
jgi:tetrahydromethanopterin S-methyltransferase subunit E